MPGKGQTSKTRTAKSTKKGPKLKWWYILPVIAIVAVAGYAIVRYSQASSEAYVKTVDNGGIKSKNPFYKYYKQGVGNLAVAGLGAPVVAEFFGTQNFNLVCAVIRGNFVEPDKRISVFTFDVDSSSVLMGGNSKPRNKTAPIEVNQGFQTVCRGNQLGGSSKNLPALKASIQPLVGKIYVYRMFLSSSLSTPQGAKVFLPGKINY